MLPATLILSTSFRMAIPVKLVATQADRPLRQAIWLVFRSSQALILESADGQILYRPLQLVEFVGADIRQTPLVDPSRDPLGYSRLAERWMSSREWAVGRPETTNGRWYP